jgi:two-component system LytT family response regulator
VYRSIIIDDELIGINALKVLIEKHTPEVKVVATTTDPASGIDLIEGYRPDIVFLDVSMPTMNGFDLLEKLQYKDFKLIFTTAHQEFAIKAIKNKAHDYLLKPIDINELQNCIINITSRITEAVSKKSTKNLVELRVKDGIIFIRFQDIIRLEASGSYTVFYLENRVRHVASKNLKECETMLDPTMFFRCHPSHIVNLKKVVKMVSTDGLFAKMTDDSMPEILRKNKESFLERLKTI